MDKKEIEKKVKEILADRLDIDLEKIKLESRLAEDLDMDSFGAIEIMFEMEEKFDIKVKEEEMKNLQTVKDIIRYIENKLRV